MDIPGWGTGRELCEFHVFHNLVEMAPGNRFQRPVLRFLVLLYFPAQGIELVPEQIPVIMGKRF